MGEVYRAVDTRLERDVAIKVLPEQLKDDGRLRERFERAAKTISQLQHPNICALYDIGSEQGIDFLVMEYLEGETLEHRLMSGALPSSRVGRCESSILAATATMSRRPRKSAMGARLMTRTLLARAYVSNGMPDEALREFQEVLRLTGQEGGVPAIGGAFAQRGESGMLEWLVEGGLRAAESGAGNVAFTLALLYGRLGETDEALSWLERAVHQRDGFAIYLKVHPWLDSLENEPRYRHLPAETGLGVTPARRSRRPPSRPL